MKKRENQNFENSKAITLIALIITIIILLILAGVTISQLSGDNGLLARAKEAREKQAQAEFKQNIVLTLAEYQTEKVIDESITLIDYLNTKNEQGELDEIVDNGDGTITVIKDGYCIIINENDLSITEPVAVNATIVNYTVTGFENNKINIVIKIANESNGIAKIIKPNGQEIEGNNKKVIGIDYQIENNVGYEFEVVLPTGEREKHTIKYEDLEAPTAKIEVIEKMPGKITANVEVMDNKSGVNLNGCKWVISTQDTNLEKDETLYTGGTLINEKQTIETNTVTETGEYYIHLLLTDNVGNVGQVISEKVIIKNEKYLMLKGGTYINTGISQNELVDGYTISTNVYINKNEQSTVTYMGIVGYHSSNTGIMWQFDGVSTILAMSLNSTSGNSGVGIDYEPYYDKWTKITMTYGNGVVKVYFDGELLWSAENASFTPVGGLSVGTSENSDRGMKGGIQSVKIWKKELTAEEISKINYEEKNTTIQKESVLAEMNFTNIEEMVGTIIGNNYELVSID